MLIDRRLIANFDWPLFISAMIIPLFGLVVLYSAGYDPDSSQYTLSWLPIQIQSPAFVKQILFLAGGLLAMLVAMSIPTSSISRYAYIFYVFCLLLLFSVEIAGVVVKGSRRWLDLGPIHFQPAELMKTGVILALARYLSKNPPPKGGLGLVQLIIPFGFFLFPMVLILHQPDLGTAMAVGMVGFCMVLFAGIQWRSLAIIVVCGLLAVYPAWHKLHDYQKRRVMVLFNPESDPLGSGYHIIQSKIAVGSGEFFGKGYLKGTQTQLQFLPEHSTDFIFSVLAEEWGFVGCVFVICLYISLLYRLLRVVMKGRDLFSALLVFGLATLVFCHAAINIGMVVGILPVVGIPLPLFSYGGSSVLSTMISIGLALGASMRRRLYISRG